jgi:ABC-type multidrug transport system ATPase subunit
VLRIEGLTKGYGGAPVLRDLSLELVRGQKLAVVGPNGIGKSTLLRLIVGELEPDAGAIHPGYEVRMGYFGQEARAPASDKITLVEWLHGESPREELGTIRGTLGRVLFSGSEAEKSVRSLSGGEAARLLLARLMLRRDNLLVLDEPTNHLDMEGREALLRALRDYEGTLLFVSHDRHFVSCLADRVLVLTAQGWEDFPGPYEEYLAREGADFLAAEQASVKRPPSLANRPRKDAPGAEPPGTDFEARKAVKRETARLARQVGLIEKEIQRLERRIAEADRYFAAPGYYERTPWEEVARVERDRAACQAELDMKMAEWETLAARLDALGEAS